MSAKNFFTRKMSITVSFGTPLEAKDVWGEDESKRRMRDFKGGADLIMLRVKELLL